MKQPQAPRHETVVFSALNLATVHLVRSTLTREGIPSRIRRDHLGPLAGETPMDDARAELLVPDEYVAAATAVIDAARSADVSDSPCPACGEANPATFEICWQCGADLDGDADG